MLNIVDYNFIPLEFSSIKYKDKNGNDVESFKIVGLVALEDGYQVCTIFDNKNSFSLSADDFKKLIKDRSVLVVTGYKHIDNKTFLNKIDFSKIVISKKSYVFDLI